MEAIGEDGLHYPGVPSGGIQFPDPIDTRHENDFPMVSCRDRNAFHIQRTTSCNEDRSLAI